MRLKLKSYNESAYKKVMAAFETNRMTCICHPTGTGKSYIIASVAEYFEKILILAPNSFVLRQQETLLRWHPNVTYYNYQFLHYNPDIANEKFDLIVLDEFHRAGAPEWQSDVKALIESQPSAKILGTSATPIRYLDKERNMAHELFDGHIASHMTIGEAWTIYNALPIPRYVCGLFRWDKTFDDVTHKIQNSNRLNSDEKRERIFRLTNTRIEWEKSYGMPSILRRHLDKDSKRVIVFCAYIETLEQMKSEVCGWFRDAGFKLAGSYTLHSNLTDKQQIEQMQGFESNEGEGVKLMFTVNILNEGIHVPNVNAVLMLRTTSSRIIYMQQMGRCLTAANTEKPLVLDMVDNITTTTSIKYFVDEYDFLEKELAYKECREPRKFEVTDYTLGVKKLIEKLTEDITITVQERLQIVLDFVKTNDRLPSYKETEMYRHWKVLRQRHYDLPEVQELLNKYRIRRTSVEERVEICQTFFDEHHRPPSRRYQNESHTVNLWLSLKKYHSDDPRVKRLIEIEKKYNANKLNRKIEKALKLVTYHCENFGRPKGSQRDEYSKAWNFLVRFAPDNPEFVVLQKKYNNHYHTTDEAFDMVIAVCEKTGEQPRRLLNKREYYMWLHLQNKYPNHSRVKFIKETYPKSKIQNQYGIRRTDYQGAAETKRHK